MEANRDTIADFFKSDDATTHRILQNLNFGFFRSLIPDYDQAWEQAHIYGGKVAYHKGINFEWLKRYVAIFASFKLVHYQPIFNLKLSSWDHPSAFVKVADAEIVFNNENSPV